MDGTEHETTDGKFTLKAGQTATFIGLAQGTYTISEVTANGWDAQNAQTAELTATGENQVNVTFTNTRAKAQLTVTKEWNDNNNEKKLRSDVTLTIGRTAGGEIEVLPDSVVLNADNNWSTTIDVESHDINGNPYTYSIVEEKFDNSNKYTADLSDTTNLTTGDKTLTAKNTLNGSLMVTKEIKLDENWDANVDFSKDAFEFTITGPNNYNQTFKLKANESQTFDYLPSGKYTVTENLGKGSEWTQQTETVTVENGKTARLTVTNEHVKDSAPLTITKDWKDAANTANRPKELTMALIGKVGEQDDGQEVYRYPVTLTADNWTATVFAGTLPTKYNGKDITYTVEEIDVPKGYAVSYAQEGNTYTVTNTLTGKIDSLTFTKVWEDQSNKYNLRPEKVDFAKKLTLTRSVDGIEDTEFKTPEVKISGEQDQWTLNFGELDRYDANGDKYRYTLEEDAIANYITKNSSVTATFDANGHLTNKTLTNMLDVGTLEVTKSVMDNSTDKQNSYTFNYLLERKGEDGRYTPYAVGDAKDGKFTIETDATNNGKLVIEELPVGDYRVTELDTNGWEVASKVGEKTAAEVVEVSIAMGKTTSAAYTNTRETRTINVIKTWNDEGNKFNTRPNDLTFNLTADGQKSKELTVKEQNGDWSGKFENLPTHTAKGDAITYTVEEQVPANYTMTKEETDNIVTFINTLNTGSLTINKEVVDESKLADQNCTFTFKVEYKLAGGTEYAKLPAGTYNNDVTVNANGELSLTVDQTDKASVTLTGLPAGEYRVTEKEQAAWTTEIKTGPNEYAKANVQTVALAQNGTATVDFRNTIVTQSVKVTKVWVTDAADADLPEVTINVKDGEVTAATVKLSGNTWSETIQLPKYDDKGELRTYTFTEARVKGYTTYDNAQTLKMEAAFATTPEIVIYNVVNTNLEVSKTWVNTPANKRVPLEINVEFDGADHPLSLNGEKQWTASMTAPKYDIKAFKDNREKKVLEFVVSETAVNGDLAGFERENVQQSEQDGTTRIVFTNTYNEGSVEITVNKTWNRPEYVNAEATAKASFDLYIVGEPWTKVESAATRTQIEGNYGIPTTVGSWKVPRYDTNGQEIVYGVRETVPNGYTVEANGLEVDNTDPTVSFVNNMNTDAAALSVSKKVVFAAGGTEDVNEKFAFTLEYVNDKNETKPVTGVSYTVGSETKTLTNGEFELGNNETAVFTGLVKGTYRVSETKENGWTTTIGGEKKSSEDVVLANDAQKVEFTNTRETMNVVVTKKWETGGVAVEELPTPTFKLFYGKDKPIELKNGEKEVTAQYDEEKKVYTFKNVPLRSDYVVKETALEGGKIVSGDETLIAADYFDFDASKQCEVNEKGEATITNNLQMATVTVQKTLNMNNTPWPNEAQTFNFKVEWKGTDGKTVEQKLSIPTESVGSATATQVAIPVSSDGREVTVTEIQTEGYTLTGVTVDGEEAKADLSQTITLNLGEAKTVAFTNQPQTGAFTLTKQDVDGKALEGVKFRLYQGEEFNTENAYGEAVETDAKGQIAFKDLPIGTYWLVETATLDDYELPAQTEANAVKVVVSGTNNNAANATVTIGGKGTNEVTLVNRLKTAGILKITKKVKDDSAFDKYDGTFTFNVTLTNENHKNFSAVVGGTTYTTANGVLNIPLELGDKDSAEITGLPYGTVATVTEKGAYAWTTSWDGNYKPTEPESTVTDIKSITVTEITSDGKAKEVTATNTRKLRTDANKVSFAKNWVDDRNSFGLRPTDTDYANAISLYQSTDEKTWTKVDGVNVIVEDNKNDTYAISYDKLPECSADGKPYSYAIVEGNVANYTQSIDETAKANGIDGVAEDGTITNTLQRSSLTVSKTVVDDTLTNVADWPETGLDFIFEIKRGDEQVPDGDYGKVEVKDGRFTIHVDAQTKTSSVTLENLAVGEYTVTEVTNDAWKVSRVAGDGDLAEPNKASAVLTAAEVGSVRFENERVQTAVTVTKKWADDDGALAEALIPSNAITANLNRDGKQVTTTTLSKGNNWKATFENLPAYAVDGKKYIYTVSEADAVDGKVTIDGITYEVNVNVDGNVITNKRVADGKTDPTKELTSVNEKEPQKYIKVGDELVYTIGYHNYNAAKANVVITDVLDAGVDYVGSSNDGKYDPATRTVTWTLTDVPAFEKSSVTVTVKVNNQAEVIGATEDTATVDNAAGVKIGDDPVVTINPIRTEIEPKIPENPVKTLNMLDKQPAASGAEATVNSVLVYTISYFNHTNKAAKVVVTDVLDEGVDFLQEGSEGGVYDEATRTVTWTIDRVEPFARDSVTLTVQVNGKAMKIDEDETTATVDNMADVTIGEEKRPTNVVVTPIKAENQPQPVKTVEEINGARPSADSVVAVGEEIVYRIDYRNHTNSTATVTVTDVLDAGVDYVSSTAGGVYHADSHTVTWEIRDVAPFTDGSVTLTVKVNENAKKVDPGENTATIDNEAGVTIGNETATSVEVEVPVKPDEPVQPTKKAVGIVAADNTAKVDATTVAVGDSVIYEVTYYNNNNTTANVVITDELDAGVKFDNASNGGVYDEATHTVTWTIENVAPFTDGSVTLTVEVTEAAKQTVEGEDQATVENTAGVQIGNETAMTTNPVEIPVEPETPTDPTKTATDYEEGDTVDVGDQIEYVIAYRNNNNVPANVVITDELDAGVKFDNASDGGVYDEATHTVTWTIENVAPFSDGSVTLTVEVTEAAKQTDPGEDQATVENTADVQIGNETAMTTNPVEIPVEPETPTNPTKTAVDYEEGDTVDVGDQIEYVIAYRNNNNVPANVVITDELDAGVRFVDATNNGVYDEATHTVTWTIENVAPFTDGSVKLTVEVTEAAKETAEGEDQATVENTAGVQIGNETAMTTNPVEIPVEPETPTDPTKTATDYEEGDTVDVGDQIEYVIAYRNNNNVPANVVITDALDAGVRFVDATNNGVYDEATHTVTWTIENVAPFTDGSVKLTVEVREAAKQTVEGEDQATVENTAGVQIGNETAMTTNPVEIPVKPEEPTNPTKTVDPSALNVLGMIEVGDELTYTIEYDNNLNRTANVTVTDALDAGLTFVSASNGGVYDEATHTVTWTIENVAPFTGGSLALVARVNENAIDASNPVISNEAGVQVGNQTEMTSVPVDVTVYNPAYEVAKTVVNAPEKGYFTEGETVRYAIAVINTGNVNLEQIIVRDEMNGESVVIEGEGYALNADGTATVALLEPGRTVTVNAEHVVTAQDLGAESIANVATVTAPDPTDPENPIEREDTETFTPDEAIEIRGTKTWDDADNAYATRPEAVTVRLYQDGTEYRTVTFGAESNWQYEFTQVPRHTAEGAEIVYTILEDAVPGYDASYAAEGYDITNTLQTYTLTVRYWIGQVGGQTAFGTVQRTCRWGERYNVASPTMTGYRSDLTAVTGRITGDAEYDVVYTPIPWRLNVRYRYQNGDTARPMYTNTLYIDEDYNIASPEIPGYVPSVEVIAGTMRGRNVSYTVIYVPVETAEVMIDDYEVPLGVGSVVMNVGDCFE